MSDEETRRVSGSGRIAGKIAAATAVLAVVWLGVPGGALAQSGLQCSTDDSTWPPGSPAVTFFPSHVMVDNYTTWLKNTVKQVLGEHLVAGRCPTVEGNSGPSCSPSQTCGADQVCASGYRPWASCPGDAGPIEQDDEPMNGNWEDPEEGPSMANDSQDTGEQGPCFCWDDANSDQYVCDGHEDCPNNALCVDGKCRCRNFDWSGCDDFRAGLSTWDEYNGQSNASEYTNHMVAEMEELQDYWSGVDVTQELNEIRGRNAYATNHDYRPLDDALVEHQREEKFDTSDPDVTERMWDRAHVTFLFIEHLPQTSNSQFDNRVHDSLDNVCKLLEGDDGGGSGGVPPLITYVVNESQKPGACEVNDQKIDVFAGMMAAGGGTGSCCYDANSDGDCSDSGDLGYGDIGDPQSFCSHVRPLSESTLRARIDPADTAAGTYICKHRTAEGETGNAPICSKPGLDCQLAGDDNEAGTNCSNNSLLGDADIMEDAMCLRTVPKGKTFSEMDYEICDSSDDGDDCRSLTTSDVTFLDPNNRTFRVKESAKSDADGDDTSCANLQVNPCPNEGELCTTPKGCTGGVYKCFGDTQKCVVKSNIADEVSCDGKDNDCDGFTDEGIATVGEAGTVEELADDDWKSASFETSFSTKPVVVGTPQTVNDAENPSQVHVRNVTTSGFETQHCELELGGSPTSCDSHGQETNGWFAINPDKLGPYAGVKAGTYDSSDGYEVRDQIMFDEAFASEPLVFSNTQTTDGDHVPRNVQPVDITRNSVTFEFCEQNWDDYCGYHQPETVGWLAVNPNANDLNAGVALGTVDTGGADWERVSFSTTFNEVPTVIAEVQTENGGGEALYAEVRNVDRSGAEIRFCEYEGNDQCDTHSTETIAWMAVDPKVTAGNSVKKACSTGKTGRCAVGVQECLAGGTYSSCKQVNSAVPEVCNGLDDDCDGTVDDIGDSWSSSWNVTTDDLSEQGNARICSKTGACTCSDPGDRDTIYRSSRAAGSLDDEFDQLVASTVEENHDDDDGDGDVDSNDVASTRCSCSE